MKTVLLPLVLVSLSPLGALANNVPQLLTCSVSESLNPPSEKASTKYRFEAPLGAPSFQTTIDLSAKGLDLSYGVETFRSETTSPGEQVLLVTITDEKSGGKFTVDGRGKVSTFYDTNAGTLFVQCAVK